RLNDKPYPIRENSFEMWNSWVDKDIISKIRKYVKINLDWFYIKSKKQIQYRDRMENEELFTLLAYLDFRKTYNKENMKYLEIYQKGDRINARVRDKKDVTSVMSSISEDVELKEAFLCSIENILEFINKLIIIFKIVLPDRSNLNESLEQMLELVFKAGKTTINYRRTLQDFYILWVLVNNLSSDSIENNEHQLINDIKSIFIKMKNIDKSEILNNLGYESFINAIEKFDKKYKYVSV
ncbi:MAG: hypothetical protein JW956_15430, partial [Calditrichaceae bacterium]|nr:hypothetical protein [Calditrichaceae bacterium]